jgi:hypothetical protein
MCFCGTLPVMKGESHGGMLVGGIQEEGKTVDNPKLLTVAIDHVLVYMHSPTGGY